MAEWHEWPVRVYYEDTDAEGVVYFASYFRFMERGRTEWLRSLGIEQDQLLRDETLFFSVTETHANFRRPARFNDQLTVRTRCIEHGRARFKLLQSVWRDDEELVGGGCTAACIDARTFRPRRLPATLWARITGRQ